MHTRHLLISLLALPSSFAQQSSSSSGNGGTTVPSSLSSGFEPDAIQLQVSYTGDSANGFADGSAIQSSSTSQTPVFALGDASGVSTVAQFTVMMVDSTDPNNMALHFLQPGFKADGDKTGIESNTQPLVKYAAPGAFGESGQRQYSFLLYQVNGQGNGNLQGLPQGGSKFDVSAFQSANGLKAAKAGVAMKVDLGGGNSNGNGNGNGGNSQSQSSATSAAPVASSSQGGNTLATSASGNGNQGGSSTSLPPVTFESPTINSGTATSTSSGATGGASTSSAGAAVTSAASESGGAGASATASSGSVAASTSASASASVAGSNDATETRYVSGMVAGLVALLAAVMVS